MRKSILILSLLTSSALAKQLPTVVITAQRIPQRLPKVSPTVSVLNSAQISNGTLSCLSDDLKELSDVFVLKNGEFGKTTSVFLLGLPSKYTLFEINGVPINDPSTPDGSALIQYLNPFGADRVELVKGAESSVYGQDAVAGVVNVIYQPPKGKGAGFKFFAGSHDTFSSEFFASDKGVYYGFSYFGTGGISATNPDAGFLYNPDRDGYERADFLLKAGTPSLYSLIKFTKARSEIDPSGSENYVSSFAMLAGKTPLGLSEGLSYKAALFQSRRDYSFGSFSGQRFYAETHLSKITELGTFLIGSDAKIDSASTSAFNATVQDYALFAEASGRLSGAKLNLSARVDRHRDFGWHASYKASVSAPMKISSTALRIGSCVGTSFKAPSLNQLYAYYPAMFGFPATVGNETLKPEKGLFSDVFLTLRPSNGVFISGLAFYTSVKDAIAYVFDPSKNVYTYQNRDKLKSKGLTVSAGMEKKNYGVSLSFSRTLSKYRTNGSWSYQQRLPKKLIKGKVWGKAGNLKLELFGTYAGKRTDGVHTLSPFAVFDAKLSYLRKNTDVFFKVLNLTDRDYQLAYGYNTLGRSYFVGLEERF